MPRQSEAEAGRGPGRPLGLLAALPCRLPGISLTACRPPALLAVLTSSSSILLSSMGRIQEGSSSSLQFPQRWSPSNIHINTAKEHCSHITEAQLQSYLC